MLFGLLTARGKSLWNGAITWTTQFCMSDIEWKDLFCSFWKIVREENFSQLQRIFHLKIVLPVVGIIQAAIYRFSNTNPGWMMFCSHMYLHS